MCNASLFLAIVLLALLSLTVVNFVDAKRRRSHQSASKVEEEEVIEYNSKEDLNAKLAELNADRRKLYGDEISPQELRKLQREEVDLKKSVLRAALNHGDMSSEKAKALHVYGKNLYKQGRYDDVLQISMDIVKIHEEIDGPEHINTGNALGNVASVAFRMEKKELCGLVSNRLLYIMIKHFGKDSKEELFHRGKMLTFQIPDAETTAGLSYEEYLEELEDRGMDDEL